MRSPTVFLLILAAPLVQLAAQQESLPSRWLAPDSATLARVQAKVQGRNRVRIFVNAAAVEVARPTLDASGIRPDQLDEWPSVPWGNVSRVQVRTSAFSRGLVIGGIVGGSLSLVAGLASTGECSGWLDMFCGMDAADVMGMTAAGALAYGLLGGLIALPFGRWSTVYQAQPRPVAPTVALVPTHDGGVGMVGSIRF